jgi:hypothetical protein
VPDHKQKGAAHSARSCPEASVLRELVAALRGSAPAAGVWVKAVAAAPGALHTHALAPWHAASLCAANVP